MLAMETSNPSAWTERSKCAPGVVVCVVGADGVVERGRALVDPTKVHEDGLMVAVDRACGLAGVKPRALTDIAVSVGPGGFTAVRIAVTSAKLVAEVTGARLVGVPTAQVVWRSCERCGLVTGEAVVALASKGRDAWVTAVGGGFDAGRLMGVDGLMGFAGAGKVLIADRFLPVGMREAWVGAGGAVMEPEFDPVACAEVAVMGLGDGWLVGGDPAGLSPMYPREPEAVTKWRAMHGGKKPTRTAE